MEQNLHQTQTVTVIALIIFARRKQWTDFCLAAEKSVHG